MVNTKHTSLYSLTHHLVDSKRSSPSLLARQLRLRLVADDESDIPRNLRNMVVSIHAIATFQALNDYLRPRITGLMSTGGLSGMLAALAASGFGPASSRNPPEAQPSKPAESSSAPKTTSETPATGSSDVGRRRSLRLSAKNGGPLIDQSEGSTTTAPTTGAAPATSSSSAPAPQSTAPHMEALIQDSGLVSDFTDDEVDAEVIFQYRAYNFGADCSLGRSLKTMMILTLPLIRPLPCPLPMVSPIVIMTLRLSDAKSSSDGSKVEAQTPDGTRIATPSTAPLTSPSRPLNANKTSYAAALKTKPSDWHLEFSMDDHLLPLDLTIYGAIHQHEMRKKLGPVPSSSMWQGIYTVKFKKINGPPQSQECR